jgi:hypothetical protein
MKGMDMDICWLDQLLIITPNGEGERRVLESVVESLSGLNRVDINHRSPTSPNGINLVDNQSGSCPEGLD